MSTENGAEKMTEREEMEMLLPWYVTGKLEPSDRERIERYIEDHEDFAAQLNLVKEEMDITITEAEALGAPSAGALDNLLAQIEAEDGKAIQKALQPSLAERIINFIPSFDAPVMKYAGIAAALVIMIQAVAIGTLLIERGGGTFETASGPEQVAVTGTQLLIAFQDEATMAEINELMSSIDATIVSGPAGGGIYKVRVSDEALPEEKVNEIIESLQAKTELVKFVSPAG